MLGLRASVPGATSERNCTSSTADEHSPKSDQGVASLDPPLDTRHWILRSRHKKGISKPLLLLASLVPIGVVFALSIVTGVTLNCVYTGSASGSSAAFVQSENRLSFEQSAIGFDALRSACICATVTSGLAMVRFGFRNFTHPRC